MTECLGSNLRVGSIMRAAQERRPILEAGWGGDSWASHSGSVAWALTPGARGRRFKAH